MAKRKDSKPVKRLVGEVEEEEVLAPTTPEGVRAYDAVLKNGFPSFPKPAAGGGVAWRVLPERPTQVSSEDLMDDMAYWTAMLGYATEQAVLVWNDLATLRERVETYVQQQLASMGGTSVTEKKARARTHPEVVRLQNRVDHLQAVYNLIDGIKKNCEANYAVLSREITRRSSSME